MIPFNSQGPRIRGRKVLKATGTNDNTAINAALAAADDGGEVVLMAGTYSLGGMILFYDYTDVKLTLMPGATLEAATNLDPAIHFGTSTRCYVEGGAIDSGSHTITNIEDTSSATGSHCISIYSVDDSDYYRDRMILDEDGNWIGAIIPRSGILSDNVIEDGELAIDSASGQWLGRIGDGSSEYADLPRIGRPNYILLGNGSGSVDVGNSVGTGVTVNGTLGSIPHRAPIVTDVFYVEVVGKCSNVVGDPDDIACGIQMSTGTPVAGMIVGDMAGDFIIAKWEVRFDLDFDYTHVLTTHMQEDTVTFDCGLVKDGLAASVWLGLAESLGIQFYNGVTDADDSYTFEYRWTIYASQGA